MSEQVIELSHDERRPCEIWSRVMGYHRPVSAYNKGKQQEHRDRRFFREVAGDDRPGSRNLTDVLRECYNQVIL